MNNRELSLNRNGSNLKLDYASGVGAITVYSITQFAVNQVLCIGEFGSESAEIVKTHASTAPTGFTVTLASNLTKSHQKDAPVIILDFDQVEFLHAATLTGEKSALGSVTTIDPESDLMTYNDTTNTSGYYFTRYKNSITTTYSDYSDGVPYTGLPEDTVGYAINQAMTDLHASFNDTLTYSKLLSWTNQMLRLVRGKKKAWSNNQEFDYEVAEIVMGTRRYALPVTLYDKNSNRTVLNVKVGNEVPLLYFDRSEYLQATEDVVYTEVATQAGIGATSLVLDDTADLSDSGTVDVFVSGVKYSVEYTVNTRSTNTLTVAADQITVIFPVDSPVWQDIEEDQPQFYNISDGYLYLWPMADSDYEGRNIIMDFYTDIVSVDSDMDVITGPRFDMLVHYLKFKIRGVLENNGVEDLKDPDYQQFREILTDAIRLEELGEIKSFRPRQVAVYGGRTGLSRR